MKVNTWSDAQKQFLIDKHTDYDNEELAKHLGKSASSVRGMKVRLNIKGGKRKVNEYAVYKGDEFLVLGTAKQCGEFLEIPPYRVHQLASDSYKRRLEKRDGLDNSMLAIKIEDDEIEAI